MTEQGCRVAVVSHSMPPAASGQAVMLGRLLEGADPARLTLVSSQPGGGFGGFAHVEVPRPAQLPMLDGSWPFAGSVALNAAWGIWRRAAQIEKILHDERCGIVIACTGDLYDIPAAFLASRRLGLAFVAYVFDDFAYQWTGARRAIARRIEAAVMPRASAVLVPNEAMRDEYRRRLGVESVVIHNPCVLPDLEALDQLAAEDPPPEDSRPRRIVYAGAIYHAHLDAFRNLLEALRILGRPALRLALYTAQPRRELEENGLLAPFVELYPYMDEAELRGVMRRADILFLPLAFESAIPEVIRTSAPGKMGDYLSVGRPILAHAPGHSFVSRYLGQERAALVVDRPDPVRLADAVRGLLDDPALGRELGARGRELAEREFDVTEMRLRLAKVLDSLGSPNLIEGQAA